MLKGLDISEVKLSEIKKDNAELRLDDDYYRKEYISIYSKLNNSVLLKDIVLMSDVSSNGSFAYVQETLNDDNPKIVPYIRSGNVGETFINSNELIKISKEAHSKLKLSCTKLYDIMMARKGKIGGASIITEQEVDYNCNENVIKLTIKDKDTYNPFYFTTFFNSKYGLKQTERLSTGNVQPWVSIYQIRKMRLKVLSIEFQKNIEFIVKKAHQIIQKSRYNYSTAENLLLNQFDITDWRPKDRQVNIKSVRETFLSAGRLDSEYYQPKYDELFEKLKEYNCKQLGEIVYIKKSIEPGSDNYEENGIPFIRVADLSKEGILESSVYLSEEQYKDAIRPKKDTILMTKDGSVGIAYKMEKDKNVITSGAILHLSIKDENVLPDYLTLLINSKIVQMQAERDAGGSIIQHWKPSEIENVIIPILPMDEQFMISEMVQDSFRLRHKSNRLLKIAKEAVEIAISDNEDRALQYIKENEVTLL